MLYRFVDPQRLLAVRKAFLPLGLRVRVVRKEEYLQPVGVLAGVKGLAPSEDVYDGADFEKEMLVMAGLSSRQVDGVLLALRKAGVGRIDYKAVLTATNQNWDSLKLYEELAREHAVMSGGKPQESEG